MPAKTPKKGNSRTVMAAKGAGGTAKSTSKAKTPAKKAAKARPTKAAKPAKVAKTEGKSATKAPKLAKTIPAPKTKAVPAPKAKTKPSISVKPKLLEWKGADAEPKPQRQRGASAEKYSKLMAKWQSLFNKSKNIKTEPYDMRRSYERQTAINHKILGWGFILDNKNDRLEVLFKDGIKYLISNYK